MTRTEKWKKYRESVNDMLTTNERDLLALYLVYESVNETKKPTNFNGYVKELISKYKVARKAIEDIIMEGEEDEDL